MTIITFRYLNMDEVVKVALTTLRERSPVGSTTEGDAHPGLYRDSHMIFLNGHNVPDVSGWKQGDEIEISNPVPYARKIEVGHNVMSLPPHVYETTAQILRGRYGNQAKIEFKYLPIRFGDTTLKGVFSRGVGPKARKKLAKDTQRGATLLYPTLSIRGL